MVLNRDETKNKIINFSKEWEEKAEKNLEVRANFKYSSLADPYDPQSMPKVLKKSYQDDPYSRQIRHSQNLHKERIEFLFELYEEYLCE